MLNLTKDVRLLLCVLGKKGLGYQARDNKNTASKNRNRKVNKENV